MKKIMIILLIILLSGFANAASYNTDTPSVKACLESISPYPVEPGQDFTIQARIYNEGGKIAEDVIADIEYSEYFFLKSKDDDFDKPFNLCAGCSKDNLYYFAVLPDTISGEYPITIKIDRGGAIAEKKVLVRVIGQPDIIFNTKLLDDEVHPDSSFDVLLNVRNVGTGIARNIKLEPTTSGFVMDESNLIFIKELKPNEEVNKTINFIVSDSLLPGPHKLDFRLAYKNEKSNQTTLNQALGVNLLNKVNLNIAAVTIDPLPIIKWKKAIITIRIENLGEGKAENIQVILKNKCLKGQTKAYIGKLDEGEDAPAVFTLTPSKAGKSELEIRVTYEDDTGKHEITDTIELLISRNLKLWLKIILSIAVLIILFVAGLGFFGYELWKSGEYETWKKKGYELKRKGYELWKKKGHKFWKRTKK